MSKELSLIFARSQNNVIGVDNDLPWKLPKDFAWFKKQTLGHPIIMGRKTFESLGNPLPKRKNIVISTKKDYHPEGTVKAESLEQAIELAAHEEKPPFIIGGQRVFQDAVPMASKIYLTEVLAEYKGDTFGPEIDWKNWQLNFEEAHRADEKHSDPFIFKVYSRKN
jgi:dihydrofolate reductase